MNEKLSEYTLILPRLLVLLVVLGALWGNVEAQDTDVYQGTVYEYTDNQGRVHQVYSYLEVPEEYRSNLSVVDRSGGGGFDLIPDSIFDLSLGVFENVIFWGLIIGLCVLHATGRLERLYYAWIDFLKERQGVSGFYKEKRTATHDTYLELLFCMAGKLCLADGAVQRTEWDELEEIIAQKLRLSEEESQRAKIFFRKGRDAKKPFDAYVLEFARIFGDRPELLKLAYTCLERVALASKEVTESEEDLLVFARAQFGIRFERSEQASNSNDEMGLLDAYAILECSPQDSFAAVKKTYRKRVLELHPDRLNGN